MTFLNVGLPVKGYSHLKLVSSESVAKSTRSNDIMSRPHFVSNVGQFRLDLNSPWFRNQVKMLKPNGKIFCRFQVF